MNELDYAILAILLVSILVGLLRGAIRELLNIAGWILAFALAYAFAGRLAVWLADWAADPILRLALAWGAIFLLVLVLVALIASLASELMRKLGLGGLNRGLGALVGFVRGLVVLVALALAAGLTRLPQSVIWQEAALTPWLEVAALYSRSLLPDTVAGRIKFRLPPARDSGLPAGPIRI
jgi:membrane protein required for colicin V production